MSKQIDEPIYFHNAQPVLVKIGEICGRQLFVELKGDAEQRERAYLLISHILQKALGVDQVRYERDSNGTAN